MRYQEMRAHSAKMFELGRQNEREYQLSERAHLMVDFMAYPQEPLHVALKIVSVAPPARPSPPPPPGYPMLGALPLPLTALTPAELVKFAEVKAMIDQWKEGKVDDLPPSTADEVRAENRRAEAEMPIPGCFDLW